MLRGGAEDFAWEGVCGLGLVDGELAVDDDVVDALGGGEEFDGGVLNIFWSNRTGSAAMPGLMLPQIAQLQLVGEREVISRTSSGDRAHHTALFISEL